MSDVIMILPITDFGVLIFGLVLIIYSLILIFRAYISGVKSAKTHIVDRSERGSKR